MKNTILEKLTVAQLVKKFLNFHKTQRYCIVFTRVHHHTPSQSRWMQL